MFLEDLSKIRRYELKYTIDESLASEIRDYIQNICVMDKNVCDGETGYVVNNLYFDTPDLRFYLDTKFKKPTRFKPRARYYGQYAGDLIWPEIKYRHGNVIWKKRYCVPVSEWPQLFYPQLCERTEGHSKSRIDRFDEVIHWFGAEPKLHVRYFREPFVTELESYGRVTFDRQLCYRRVESSDLTYEEKDMIYFDDPLTTRNEHSPVILEIKVETLVPIWAIELIRTFHLNQRSFSKYCYGIDFLMGNPTCRTPISERSHFYRKTA